MPSAEQRDDGRDEVIHCESREPTPQEKKRKDVPCDGANATVPDCVDKQSLKVMEDTAGRYANSVIAKIAPKKGELVIITIDKGQWGGCKDMLQLAGEFLHEATGCYVFLVADGFNVDSISEEAMNAAGWYRVVPDKMYLGQDENGRGIYKDVFVKPRDNPLMLETSNARA